MGSVGHYLRFVGSRMRPVRLESSRSGSSATALLQEVRSVTPGQTADEDIQRIVQKYGGDTGRQWGDDCEQFVPSAKTYAVDVESKWDNWIGARDILHRTHLRVFGATVWRANAFFGIQNGHLACVRYRIASIPAHSASVFASIDYRLPEGRSDVLYAVGFRRVHSAKNLNAFLTTEAPEIQRGNAFGFNLSCLSRIGGCRNVCEVMPSAWRDYEAKARAQGDVVPPEGALPPEELSAPRCKTP